jgi:hypothetical protein
MTAKTYKQVYIKIPDIHKKINKLENITSKINIYNKIISNFGEYKILNNDIEEITNIPIQCFSDKIQVNNEFLDIYVNLFERNEKKNIYHIPNESVIIHIKETIYKLDNVLNTILIKEESIILNEDVKNEHYNNEIINSYYFKINGENVDLQIIKEDIFAFLNYLK